MSTKLCKNNIKCAVFDLDGTLLNTIKTINYYLNFALRTHGFSSVSKADTMSFVGDGAVKLIERALGRANADLNAFDSVYRTYNEAYNSSPYYLTEPYEGILELLDFLREQGIALAVLSNKPDFAVKATVNHFFGNSFDLVLGGRENIPLKPDPASLLDLIECLGFDKEEVIYVGDSEVDVLTAKNGGLKNAIFVSYGFRTSDQLKLAGAKQIVGHPGQIAALISDAT